MKTIWKYKLSPTAEIDMPKDAQILSVQEQHDEAILWALVDPNNIQETRVFKTYGTGHEVPDSPGKFIGTFQLHGGFLVFHVFEQI